MILCARIIGIIASRCWVRLRDGDGYGIYLRSSYGVCLQCLAWKLIVISPPYKRVLAYM